MKFYILAVSVLVLASCGQKDPLADQPEYIRNATPGFEKGTPAVATRENMIISSNTPHFFYTEGVEGQSTISGRILLDGYNSEMQIENISDFEGATFDSASGLFSWKPKKGTVSGIGSTRTTFVRVRLNGLQRATNITATRTEDFPVTISRLESQPTIVKESGFPASAAREGDSLRITIYVKDVDGVNQPGAKPRIFVHSPADKPRVGDLTPYIRVASEDDPEQDFSDPSLWKFTLNVALTDADVTKNTGDFYFRVTAISRFGKYSPTKDYKISILTSVETPLISGENFDVQAGTSMINDILIMDPRQEGKVSVEVQNAYDFPADFKVKCETPVATPWMAKCRATWATATPPAGPTPFPAPAVTEVSVRLKATNRSPVSYDRLSVDKIFNLKFKVVTP